MVAGAGTVSRTARSAREPGGEAIDGAIQRSQGVGIRRCVGRHLERVGFQGGTPFSKRFGAQLVNSADAHTGTAQDSAGVLACLVDLTACFELCAFEGGLGFAFRRENLVNGLDFGAHPGHLNGTGPALRSLTGKGQTGTFELSN